MSVITLASISIKNRLVDRWVAEVYYRLKVFHLLVSYTPLIVNMMYSEPIFIFF